MTTRALLVEGWRHIPHSYAIVNQFQCLELATRSDLRLAHRDIPHPDVWKRQTGLFDPVMEEAIDALRPPEPEERFDAVLRMGFPYDYRPSEARRTLVFGTAEWRKLSRLNIVGQGDVRLAASRSDAIMITPSQWSRTGCIESGFPESRVFCVPHGVHPSLHHPLSEEERIRLRQRLGWDGFVFLTIGSMTHNKGLDLTLRAFATLLESHPDALLFIKGLDSLYGSRDKLLANIRGLTHEQKERIRPRVRYEGRSLSFRTMALLYQAADAYVSPYRGEGFNMPVLEAVACGLPVICTAGGATDDFTTSDFALRIDSRIEPITPYPQVPDIKGWALQPDPDHLFNLMTHAVETPDFCRQARHLGPAFVANGFTWRHVIDQLLNIAFS
ncbi:glycosyltransferase [Azospirillum cavernae]|uniref:Glycosyltransferase n=1 Tax=Azospirillum cavernae TaxID=2320860 RepID=A0A418VL23_9PROT|nr:glycosyltransferase [Azospirillum cavernae]RJF76850.1 glycosyltransferase [Azospirillum cavernae]